MNRSSMTYRVCVAVAVGLMILSAAHFLVPHGHFDEVTGQPCLICAALSCLLVAGAFFLAVPETGIGRVVADRVREIPHRRIHREPHALRGPPSRLVA